MISPPGPRVHPGATPFALSQAPVLSRGNVLRRDDLREHAATSRDLWLHGQLLLIDANGHAPIDRDGSLTLLDTAIAGTRPPTSAVFVGRRGEVSYWAASKAAGPSLAAHFPADQIWADLQALGAVLPETDCGVFTTALAILNWQRQAVHCERCGCATVPTRAGWVHHCAGCDREEYPRVDPAVICLVHDGVGGNGSRVLLGRKPSRPAGWASLPAGYVEPGESLEAGVAREVKEEVGVSVRDLRYLGSQPWPFPRSLLIAFTAEADDGQAIDVGENGEFMEARWVHRDIVLAAAGSGGVAPGLVLPPATSIAHRMLVDWALAG